MEEEDDDIYAPDDGQKQGLAGGADHAIKDEVMREATDEESEEEEEDDSARSRTP